MDTLCHKKTPISLLNLSLEKEGNAEMDSEPNWEYKQDQNPGAVISPNSNAAALSNPGQPEPPGQSDFSVQWSASEFIAHQKNAGWYLVFFLGVGAVTAFVFFITRDIFTTILIGLVGIAMEIFGARTPRSINYSMDEQGVTVGQKFYGWEQFKSFALVEEGAIDSIYLTPLKRFMPAISMYFEPKDGQRILDLISSFLPQEERTRDFVDNLMHKIRF